MLKREEIENPKSCLNKAHENEPVFVLRANDPLAPEVVRYWAKRYLENKHEDNTDGIITRQQHDKADEANRTATQMYLWRTRREI